MSKRFGRNQRRRAREQIERLASMYMEQQSINRRQRETIIERDRDIADLTSHIQYVAAVLGHLSVLNPSLHHVDGHDGMQLHAPQPDAIVGAGLLPNEVAMIEVMRCLDIDVVRDAMRQNIHCIIHMAESQVAYALSESALRKLTREQLAVLIERRVAPALADLLAGELKAKYA